jgi:hypothetical protein
MHGVKERSNIHESNFLRNIQFLDDEGVLKLDCHRERVSRTKICTKHKSCSFVFELLIILFEIRGDRRTNKLHTKRLLITTKSNGS